MTDLETIERILHAKKRVKRINKEGLMCDEEICFKRVPKENGDIELHVEGGGYDGFVTVFTFAKDGEFLDIGAWE